MPKINIKADTASAQDSAVKFNIQRNGYDCQQVDRYIAKLSQAYQNAYNEHTDISNKYNRLLEEYSRLEQRLAGSDINNNAMTQALLNLSVHISRPR